MNKFSRYPAYKDSGFEWLGEVPEHWTIVRAKDICKIFVPQRDKPELNEEGGIAWVTSDLLENTVINFNKISYFVSEEEIKIKKIRKVPVKSVLATCVGEFSLTAINSVPVIINQQIQAYSCIKKVYSEVINYQIQANITKEYFERFATETTIKYINKEKFSLTPIYIPPHPEQKTIARYLDTKTAQIDRKIDLFTQKAKLYSNLKQSLINETVTRGLDKSVPMKDSGIEWLGEVPEHWKAKRVKDIGLIVLGKMLDNTGSNDKCYRYYLKSKNIGWIKVDISSVEKMYFSTDEMKYCRLKHGDLLLSEGGEVGKTSIWEDEIDECYIQNSVQKITIYRKNYSRYYLYQSFLFGKTKYYDSIVNYAEVLNSAIKPYKTSILQC